MSLGVLFVCMSFFMRIFAIAFGRIGAPLLRDCDTERPRAMVEEFSCSVKGWRVQVATHPLSFSNPLPCESEKSLMTTKLNQYVNQSLRTPSVRQLRLAFLFCEDKAT